MTNMNRQRRKKYKVADVAEQRRYRHVVNNRLRQGEYEEVERPPIAYRTIWHWNKVRYYAD